MKVIYSKIVFNKTPMEFLLRVLVLRFMSFFKIVSK